MPLTVTTVDYHTAGEPFRIVTGGVRPLLGRTILEKRRDALEHLDDVRRLLVHEPRGHADMYGCFVTEPEGEGADLGVALVTWALESGAIRAPESGEAEVVVDVPSGRLPCVAVCRDGRVGSVRFRNVPAFVLATGLAVGGVELDVAYGGAFYGSVDVRELGLRVRAADLPRLIALQRELRPAIETALDVVHPLEPELKGIYGVVFYEHEADAPELRQRNVAVFADGEVDRSPCGSGTSARLALLHAAGRIGVGEPLRHGSIVGTEFVGRVVSTASVAGRPAVVTEVEGSAYLTGRHEFVLEDGDPLATGFLLR
jgi:proline racemase/trans-L-3-hydroxyproline dehydratase